MPKTDSSSSAEAPAGFQRGRRLGHDLWEAVQIELDRPVVLRRLPPGTPFDVRAWPERPGVVPLYAVAEEPSGTYVATRLVPGARTLAELRTARPSRRRRWLDQASDALHGAVHGRLTEHDILVDADGRAWVTGFGRAPAGATAATDAQVLDRLRPSAASPARLIAASLIALVAVAVAAVFVARQAGADTAPSVTAGATAVGSQIAPGGVTSVDCEGAAADGASPSCTVMQAALPGTALAAGPGLVRGWAVRGVRGTVALQVLVPAGDGFMAYNRSEPIEIDAGDRARLVPADLSYPAGARFALEVGPGTSIGLRRGVEGAQTARFFGPLRSEPRAPRTIGGDGEELLLRVDVVRGG